MGRQPRAQYVLGDNGEYYIQLVDATARWGFYLLADDQCWDGGFGSGASSWVLVPIATVPLEVRRTLDWLFEEIRDAV